MYHFQVKNDKPHEKDHTGGLVFVTFLTQRQSSMMVLFQTHINEVVSDWDGLIQILVQEGFKRLKW